MPKARPYRQLNEHDHYRRSLLNSTLTYQFAVSQVADWSTHELVSSPIAHFQIMEIV